LNRELHQHHFNKGKIIYQRVNWGWSVYSMYRHARQKNPFNCLCAECRVVSAKPAMLIYPHCSRRGVQQQAGGQSSRRLKASLHPQGAGRIGFWLQLSLSLIIQAGRLHFTKDQSDPYKFMSLVGS